MKKLPFCERVCHKQNFTNETFYFGDVWLLFALPWTPPPPHVYRKHEVTNMGLHLTSVGSHSRLFESLSSMLSRSALNPADISIVRLYCIAPLTSIHCVDIGMTHFISHTYWSETCLCWHLWLKKTLKTTTYLCPSIACTSLISEERPPPSSVGSLVIVMDRISSMSINGVFLLSFLQLYKHYTEDDPPPPVQFLQTPHLLGLYGEYFLFVKFSCRPTKIFWYYTGTHLMFIDFSCIRAKFEWTHCSNRIYCDSISYCCACSELLVQAFFKPGSAINKDHKEKYLHILAYASSVYDNEDGERLTTRLYIAVNYYTVELNLATIYFLELLLSSFGYIVQGWTVPTVDLGCTWSGGICIIKWSV